MNGCRTNQVVAHTLRQLRRVDGDSPLPSTRFNSARTASASSSVRTSVLFAHVRVIRSMVAFMGAF